MYGSLPKWAAGWSFCGSVYKGLDGPFVLICITLGTTALMTSSPCAFYRVSSTRELQPCAPDASTRLPGVSPSSLQDQFRGLLACVRLMRQAVRSTTPDSKAGHRGATCTTGPSGPHAICRAFPCFSHHSRRGRPAHLLRPSLLQ